MEPLNNSWGPATHLKVRIVPEYIAYILVMNLVNENEYVDSSPVCPLNVVTNDAPPVSRRSIVIWPPASPINAYFACESYL